MRPIEHLPSLETKEKLRWRRYLSESTQAIVGALLVTGGIYIFHLYPRIPNISLTYLLVVLLLASRRGLYAAVLAAFVAFLSFDFFLVPPLYTFTIGKIDEWLALFIFLVTAIITSQLASALRQRAEQARLREHETRILYNLVQATNQEEDLNRQLNIVAQAMVDVFSSWGVRDCAILLPDVQGKLRVQGSVYQTTDQIELSPDEEASASWVMTKGQTLELYAVSLVHPHPHGSPPRPVVRRTVSKHSLRRHTRLIPLKMGQKSVGVLRLLVEDHLRLFSREERLGVERERLTPQIAFFETFVDQASAIIERARLHRESLQIEVLQRTDTLRAALLSSASHDLRTPLSSIKAAATSLLQDDIQWDDEARRSFALAIEQEANRLNRLVENLLDMSRIEGGALKPEKEWYPIDELIHDVLGRLQPLLQERTVQTHLPADLPPVELDYMQIDQVLTNLIENAIRYTPSESPIEISVWVDTDQIIISVADRGPGIAQADRERLFDKFYRVLGTSSRTARTTGFGLGLAVSRGLVEAHGGRIWTENREGGGTNFLFTLPLGKAEGIVS